jgi:hypothetical protein
VSTSKVSSRTESSKPKAPAEAPKQQGWTPRASSPAAPLRTGYLNPYRRTGEYQVLRDFGQSKAGLPNDKLKALFDQYKADNFGNAPHVSQLRLEGKEAYLFSARHGIGNPATVYIHSATGKLLAED